MPQFIGNTERRGRERTPVEITSLEDARRLVENVGKRNADNNSTVRKWRFAKQAAWLFLLIVAFLLYYLVGVVYQVVALP